MKRSNYLVVGVLALALMSAAGAQTPATNPPGRIHLIFGGLAKRAAEVGDVTLDGPMLQLGLRMLSEQHGDDGDARILARLQGVYVRSFRFDGTGEYSDRDLTAIERQLQAPGWSQILGVYSRHEHRRVQVFVLTAGSGVIATVIIAEYPTELRVVNLVGPIDLAALSQLSGHFGIPEIHNGGRDHDEH